MSTIVIFGGTGYAGGNIAAEAVRRGHRVVSYSRNLPEVAQDGVEYRQGSLTDPETVAAAAREADDLIVAVRAQDVSGAPLADRLPGLLEEAATSGVRLGFVGGAGSSLVSPDGPRLLDTPDFHDDWKPEATAHAAVLELLRSSSPDVQWFYVSPAALFGSFAPGETTGAYRTNGDVVVTKEDGSSEISGTDFALAFVDEIERQAHPQQRFTVGH